MSARTYLDHAATTPVLPQARAAMADALASWANPSSPHADGRAARRSLEDARARIKAALGWSGDVIFTASVSEGAGIAFARTRRDSLRHALSTVEHDAVLRQAGQGAVTLPVDDDGLLELAALSAVVAAAPGLVAVQHANSETGVLQPVEAIAAIVRAAGATLLVDAAQTAGKMLLPDADMILIGAHKFGGAPGAAALLVKDLGALVPTGSQERGYRPGTENWPAIAAMAAALDARRDVTRAEALARQSELRRDLEQRLTAHGATVIAAAAPRSPLIGAYAMPGMSAQAQLVRFDGLGFAVSAGSACASGSMKPSHVLAAMRLDPDLAARTIRVSFSLDTPERDVTAFADAWIALATEAARRAA